MAGPLIRSRYLVLFLALSACAPPPHAETRLSEADSDIAELWQEPIDLLERDLLAGPGGTALAPAAGTTFDFVAFKTSGTNPGYTVRDATGRLWSVKLGVEAQSEVTASRILWAIGFHQPATYYLPEFTMTGVMGGTRKDARFRTDVDPWRPGGEWSWYENPFAGTQTFRGLIVAQLILNAWDLKTPNNRIYFSTDPSMRPSRQFIVRDVGSSLGSARQFGFFHRLGTRGFQGTKNDIDGFEQQGFITGVEGNRVRFDYRGVNQALINLLTIDDVAWACELLGRIPDEHWHDAFRAGNYAPAVAARYIRKIRDKIAQGLALGRAPSPTR